MLEVYRFASGPVTVVGEHFSEIAWMQRDEIVVFLHERSDERYVHMGVPATLQSFFLRKDGKVYWTHIHIRNSSRFVKIDG